MDDEPGPRSSTRKGCSGVGVPALPPPAAGERASSEGDGRRHIAESGASREEQSPVSSPDHANAVA